MDAIVKLYGNLYPSDYKTSKCSTPEEFKAESYKLDYDLQAANGIMIYLWNQDINQLDLYFMFNLAFSLMFHLKWNAANIL